VFVLLDTLQVTLDLGLKRHHVVQSGAVLASQLGQQVQPRLHPVEFLRVWGAALRQGTQFSGHRLHRLQRRAQFGLELRGRLVVLGPGVQRPHRLGHQLHGAHLAVGEQFERPGRPL
jgi:hypothetical protein